MPIAHAHAPWAMQIVLVLLGSSLLVQRNGQKRDKKNRRGNTTGQKCFFPQPQPQLFWPTFFDMDFMVFLNSPC
jgi:hypothetical protein